MTNPVYMNAINYGRSQTNNLRQNGDNNLWLVYDALVFSWQNSKIVQKGKKLCCPTINRIAELANVSERTAHRKLKKLELMGLITSFTKRLKNGTVRSFFSICIDKIEQVVNRAKKEPKMATQTNEYAETAKMAEPELPNCQFHIYKEKTGKEKNNINNNTTIPESNKPIDQQNDVTVNFTADAQVDVDLPDRQITKAINPEDTIGNTLTKRQHCRINGAINNLIRKEGIRISDPKGLKSQVAFKILLKSDKSGHDNFQHQLNAVMKLIREGRWSTPHGYYKHSDEGRAVKAQINIKEPNTKDFYSTKKGQDTLCNLKTPPNHQKNNASAEPIFKTSSNIMQPQKSNSKFTNPFKGEECSEIVKQQLEILKGKLSLCSKT